MFVRLISSSQGFSKGDIVPVMYKVRDKKGVIFYLVSSPYRRIDGVELYETDIVLYKAEKAPIQTNVSLPGVTWLYMGAVQELDPQNNKQAKFLLKR